MLAVPRKWLDCTDGGGFILVTGAEADASGFDRGNQFVSEQVLMVGSFHLGVATVTSLNG